MLEGVGTHSISLAASDHDSFFFCNIASTLHAASVVDPLSGALGPKHICDRISCLEEYAPKRSDCYLLTTLESNDDRFFKYPKSIFI